MPFWLAKLKGAILQLLPKPPLTVDQVRLLEADNVVSEAARRARRTLEGLGIEPVAIAAMLAPSYKRWAKNPQLNAFVRGVTAAATGAIAGAVIVLARRSIYDVATLMIAVDHPWGPHPLEGAGADLDSLRSGGGCPVTSAPEFLTIPSGIHGGNCFGGYSYLLKCPAELYGDDITLWHDAGFVRAQDQSLPSAVPDDEQVIARFDCPAQARICAHVLRFGVVLNEAAEHQIGAPGVGTLQLPQALNEVALGKVPEIILDIGFQLHSAFWRRPLQIVLPLRQVAIVERAEPSGISKLQWTVTAGLRFETVPRELVRAWRDDNSGSDGKRCQQDFAVRVPVELEAIASLEPDIDWCHEIFPGFEYALGIGVANVFVLKELLANPAEGTVLGRARLVSAEGIGATRARPRKKSKQRLQRDAELVHARIAIQQGRSGSRH